jgi:MOSC domain-containing protein YiiM
MRLVSVNVGLPRLLAWKGETFKTGIFKQPVQGRIVLRATNLDGDRQADLSVHGGVNKAAYVYASEHYAYWRGQLPQEELHWGALGKTSPRKECSKQTYVPGMNTASGRR